MQLMIFAEMWSSSPHLCEICRKTKPGSIEMAVKEVMMCIIGCNTREATYNLEKITSKTFDVHFEREGKAVASMWFTIVDDINQVVSWKTILPFYPKNSQEDFFKLQLEAIDPNQQSIVQIRVYADLV